MHEEERMNNRAGLMGMVILAVLGLALAGCGPRTANLEVTTTDFEFTPDSWEVPAGAEVNITMTNEGTLEHEWVIMNLGTEATAPFDEDDEPNVFWEGEVEPGESETFTFTAPTEPGEYQIVCGTATHLENGMVGTLLVNP
jgi:plastocyanin